MTILIPLVRLKRAAMHVLNAVGLEPGEPGIAWDDDANPKLFIGDRAGVPRPIVVTLSSVAGIGEEIDNARAAAAAAASSAATSAAGATAAAAASASVASQVAEMTDDDKISAPEKTALLPTYDALMAEQEALDGQAEAFLGMFSPEQAEYDSNLNNLHFFATYSGLWVSMTVTTDLGPGGGAVFLGYVQASLVAKQALLNAISALAKALADAAQATGTGAQTTASAAMDALSALVPALNFVGEFSSPPTEAMIGALWLQNSVYKNSADLNTYVLTGTPLAWALYLEGGSTFYMTIESTQGTAFRPGAGSTTRLNARLFRNAAEVTSATPDSWFAWRRVSADPQPYPNDDTTWASRYTAGYRSLDISVDDIFAKATFFCDITAP